VIHAFSGSLEMAQQFIARDFLVGVGGTITYARAQKTREALRQVPIESVLLETDAPDMPLCGKQGARNSPHYLLQIAQCLAELRGISLDDIAQATRRNTQRLFGVS
jgi:TatD DNase family protein